MDSKDIQILQKDAIIMKLKQENSVLNEIVENLRKQLEKYTNNERHKKYYEQNKDKVKENAKQYLNKLKIENPEKLKEYRHRAYLKRKEKIMKIEMTLEDQ
jgi:ABC-type dipeptide/oligopeptide/nickel transport system ATPase component